MITSPIIFSLLGVVIGVLSYNNGKKIANIIRKGSTFKLIVFSVIITFLLLFLQFYIYRESSYVYDTLQLSKIDNNISLISLYISRLIYSYWLGSFLSGIALGLVIAYWLRVHRLSTEFSIPDTEHVSLKLGSAILLLAIVSMFYPTIDRFAKNMTHFSGAGFSMSIEVDKDEEYTYFSEEGYDRGSFPIFVKSFEYINYINYIYGNIKKDIEYLSILSNNENFKQQHSDQLEKQEKQFSEYIIPLKDCMLHVLSRTNDPDLVHYLFATLDHSLKLGQISEIKQHRNNIKESIQAIAEARSGYRRNVAGQMPVDNKTPNCRKFQRKFIDGNLNRISKAWNDQVYGVTAIAFLLGSTGAHETAAVSLVSWLDGYYRGGYRNNIDSISEYYYDWYAVRAMIYLGILLEGLDRYQERHNVASETIRLMKNLYARVESPGGRYLKDTDLWMRHCTSPEIRQEVHNLVFGLIAQSNSYIKSGLISKNYDQSMLQMARRNASLPEKCIMQVEGLDKTHKAIEIRAEYITALGELIIHLTDEEIRTGGYSSQKIFEQYSEASELLHLARSMRTARRATETNDQNRFTAVLEYGLAPGTRRIDHMLEYLADKMPKYH